MTNLLGLPLIDPVVSHGVASVLAIVWLLGAWDKGREPALFQAAVDNHRLLPSALVLPAAWAMTLAEAATGAALLTQATRSLGAALSLALLLVYSAAIATNLARGRDHIDCGCGSGRHTPLSSGLLLRNLVLGLASTLALCAPAPRPMTALDAVAVAGVALFGFGLYLLANTLLSHHAHIKAMRHSHHPH